MICVVDGLFCLAGHFPSSGPIFQKRSYGEIVYVFLRRCCDASLVVQSNLMGLGGGMVTSFCRGRQNYSLDRRGMASGWCLLMFIGVEFLCGV